MRELPSAELTIAGLLLLVQSNASSRRAVYRICCSTALQGRERRVRSSQSHERSTVKTSQRASSRSAPPDRRTLQASSGLHVALAHRLRPLRSISAQRVGRPRDRCRPRPDQVVCRDGIALPVSLMRPLICLLPGLPIIWLLTDCLVSSPPSLRKGFKLIILDEADMMTNAAQAALRRGEYPHLALVRVPLPQEPDTFVIKHVLQSLSSTRSESGSASSATTSTKSRPRSSRVARASGSPLCPSSRSRRGSTSSLRQRSECLSPRKCSSWMGR
jgi:hypothetical protein